MSHFHNGLLVGNVGIRMSVTCDKCNNRFEFTFRDIHHLDSDGDVWVRHKQHVWEDGCGRQTFYRPQQIDFESDHDIDDIYDEFGYL